MTEQDEKQIERIRREYNSHCQSESDMRFLLRMLDNLQNAEAYFTQDAAHWRERCEVWARRAKALELECGLVAAFARQTIRLVPMRKAKRKVYQWCAKCIENAIANVNEKCPEPKEREA